MTLMDDINDITKRATEELEAKHRAPQLTSKQYAAQQGLVCPYCLEAAIFFGQMSIGENEATMKNECVTCDAEWTEVYHLVGYREV